MITTKNINQCERIQLLGLQPDVLRPAVKTFRFNSL